MECNGSRVKPSEKEASCFSWGAMDTELVLLSDRTTMQL